MEPYQLLEDELVAATASTHVVACASGTAALHLALETLRLPPGSKVLVPDYTMVACPRAVVAAGLTPVFVDCMYDLTLDPGLLDAALSPGVMAVMPVHVYGRLCAVSLITLFARRHGLAVVEDCAESWGANHPHPTHARCWSFYRNKIVAGEEGGAVGFMSGEAAAHARQLRSLGFTEAHDYDHVPRGWNHRMSNVHAELVRKRLRNWDVPLTNNVFSGLTVAQQRRSIEGWYGEYCPPAWRQPPRDAVWVYDFRVPGMTREQQDRVVKNLRTRGVEARHGFKPMSSLEEFRGCQHVATVDPATGETRAEAASREVIYLPVRPGVTTEADCELAFRVVRDMLGV